MDVPSCKIVYGSAEVQGPCIQRGSKKLGYILPWFLPHPNPGAYRKQASVLLEAAHAVPSFLLFIKLPWQHLALCRRTGAVWPPWVKRQAARAACSARARGDSPCRGMGMDQVRVLFCLGTPPPEDNPAPHSRWAHWLAWLSSCWYVNCEEHLRYI